MVCSLPYAGAVALSILAASSWISNIHAAAAASPRSGGSSYLYGAVETSPVMDHGLRGHDFTQSTSPKVVEFYDPRCGACRAFKSNYAETARRVVARRPDVEFYGVSCEAHPDVCSRYGGRSVPRILAFPNGGGIGGSDPASDSVEVPKGAGTVHFLSERLIKALRGTGEIASDAARLKLSESSETTKRLLRARRFDEGSDDHDAREDAAEEGEEGDASEDREETHESDEDEEPDDRGGSHDNGEGGHDRIDGSPPTAEDRVSDDDRVEDSESERGKKSMALEYISGDGVSVTQKRLDKRMRSGQVQRQQQEEPQQDHQQQEHEQREKQQQQSKQLEPKQQQQPKQQEQKQTKKQLKKIVIDEGAEEKNSGSQDRQGAPDDGQEQAEDQDSDTQQVAVEQEQEQREKQQQQSKQLESKQQQQPKQQEQRQQQQQQQQIPILQPKQQEQKQTKKQLKQIVIDEDAEEKNSGSRDRRGPDDGQEQAEDQDSDTQQVALQQTDAYKNTKEHFDRLDIKHGTKPGHHFEEYKRARAAVKNQSVRGSLPAMGATSQKLDVVEPKNAPGPIGSANAQSRTISMPLPEGIKGEDQDKDWGGEFVSEGKYAPSVIEADPVRSVKFREYVARRKEILERKEKMKHPINALLGKVGANKEGDVTAVLKKSSPMKNYKAQFNVTSASRQIKVPDLRPEAQKKSLGKKILKAIPIVKRAFKRSQVGGVSRIYLYSFFHTKYLW
jgi:colicin import membrane protein